MQVGRLAARVPAHVTLQRSGEFRRVATQPVAKAFASGLGQAYVAAGQRRAAEVVEIGKAVRARADRTEAVVEFLELGPMRFEQVADRIALRAEVDAPFAHLASIAQFGLGHAAQTVEPFVEFDIARAQAVRLKRGENAGQTATHDPHTRAEWKYLGASERPRKWQVTMMVFGAHAERITGQT